MSVVHVYEPSHKPMATKTHERHLRSRRRTWQREDTMSGRTRKRVSYMRRKAADELTFVVGAGLVIIAGLIVL